MERKKRVKITIDNAGNAYFYKGIIIEEDQEWITFSDDKEGTIRLNKNKIISIKEEQE